MNKRKLDIHIEVDFATSYQERLLADVLRAVIKNWREFAQASHKKNIITVQDERYEDIKRIP